ncbi:MAG: hypothetical protein R6W88_15400 [Desulfobacterales bacterium]
MALDKICQLHRRKAVNQFFPFFTIQMTLSNGVPIQQWARWFSGFANQRFWLAALLALRHSGLRQYFWRLALRESGINNPLQLQHFFLLIPVIGNPPPDCQCYGKK